MEGARAMILGTHAALGNGEADEPDQAEGFPDVANRGIHIESHVSQLRRVRYVVYDIYSFKLQNLSIRLREIQPSASPLCRSK